MTQFTEEQLISHEDIKEPLEVCVQKISTRLQQEEKPHDILKQQLTILAQLQEFDFGRFLLQNRGINGYWTHYMVTHPLHGRMTGKNNRGKPFSALERFILDKAPTMLGTQERFEIFLRENQKAARNGAKLACIPCGMMSELLYLDLTSYTDISLVGIDYDLETLNDARHLAEKKQLTDKLKLHHADAWHLNIHDEFDLISSNGLTIYEPSDERVIALFQGFYNALKPQGKLVTSFLTPPPNLTAHCEWDMSVIVPQDLLLQKMVFVDVLNAKFQCYRSTEQTRNQLATVGFTEIEFFYDKGKMFPTVVAYKK
ncbi:SAM-dependent methyltransferase [Legionella cardiaca]|uniref:Class I SAM-dependent methyltransferase n=1 Tax=Legionella cardiaca TaxID=1071983 RepID=A0ABY8AUG1_9GAMM|nr:class I SAM-dependent methyltransferase [Legionella cardiaca]WED42772.1 class I SAM-dependent methyltransferase [Legionella cardiaca]